MATRICLLTTDLEIGGVPLLTRDLACGLAAAGFDIHVACLAPAGPIADQLRQSDIPVHPLGAKGPWDVAVLVRLAGLLERLRPDILHCSLVHANIAGRIAGSLVGTGRIIASIHTTERNKKWHLTAETLTCRLSDLTVCVSGSVERHTRLCSHVPPQRLSVIPNGIDCERFARAAPADRLVLGIDPHMPTLLFVGRLDPVKDLTTLLDAMGHLPEHCPAQLLIVGDGPDRARLEQRSIRLGLTGRVRFLGYRDDVPAILKAADIFVMPSLWEGFGLAALEAMAAGLPVIASRTSGLAELVLPGQTGLLVPSRDIPALAAAIVRLVQDAPLRERLGVAGQTRARHSFSLASMVTGYAHLYRRILTTAR